jgi:predicted HicB family RNase H-like nuclease
LEIELAQKTVVHKGYHGTIEVNIKDYSLYGKILFIDEDFTYRGQNFAELDANFQAAVEKHIKLCKEKGQEPPFSD